jgi:hypothetical protein
MSGVSCLVIRTISGRAGERAGADAARLQKVAAENSARLVAAVLRELERGAPTAAERHSVKRWVVAYELAFGDATPYSREFPSLYDARVAYAAKRAVTREVLDRITRLAARETKVHRIRFAYMPGAYKDYGVVPSAQLSVEGTASAVGDFMAVVGYLAQQTEVIASTPVASGGLAVLQVTQTSGEDLAAPAPAERFWKQLRTLAPELPGFSVASANGQPTLTVIATEGEWDAGQKARIQRAVASAASDLRLPAKASFKRVALLSCYNNWLLQPAGQGYLDRLSRRGRSDLARWLRSTYRASVTQWIKRAYRQYPRPTVRTRSEPRDGRKAPQAERLSIGASLAPRAMPGRTSKRLVKTTRKAPTKGTFVSRW